MKKIVALVLSLVMALSLCTVAFGADYIENGLYGADKSTGKADYTKFYGVVETKDAKVYSDGTGNVTYYVWKEAMGAKWPDGSVIDATGYYYIPCSYDEADYVVNTNGSFTTYVKAYAPDPNFTEAYYKTTLTAQSKNAGPATCTVAHYRVDGYLDTKGNFYVKSNDADATRALVGNVIVKVKYTEAYSNVVYASHVLLKGTADKNGYDVCKCAICGGTFACTKDMNVLAANKISLNDVFGYVNADAKAVIADNNEAGKYNMPVATDLAGDYTFCWQLTAGTETKPAETKPGVDSAKTFDAGIAMYVGMSLLSVAGSAVVIGKKKEF